MQGVLRNYSALATGQMLVLDALMLIVAFICTYAAAACVRDPRRFMAAGFWWLIVAVLAPFYYAFARDTTLAADGGAMLATGRGLYFFYSLLIATSVVWGVLVFKGRAAQPFAVRLRALRTYPVKAARGVKVATKGKKRYTVRNVRRLPFRINPTRRRTVKRASTAEKAGARSVAAPRAP